MKFTIKQIILVILVVVLVRLIIISRKEGFSQVSDKKVCVILFGFAPILSFICFFTISQRVVAVVNSLDQISSRLQNRWLSRCCYSELCICGPFLAQSGIERLPAKP